MQTGKESVDREMYRMTNQLSLIKFLCSLVCFMLVVPNAIAESEIRIFAPQENASFFEIDGKYGVMDRNKKMLIPAIFDSVEPFDCGMAIVWKDGKGGCINTKGEWMIDPEWNYIEKSVEFSQDGLFIVSQDGKFGCINKNSAVVIPIEYDGLHGFINKTAIVLKNGLQGVISVSGEEIVKPVWESVTFPHGGYATACNGNMDYVFINTMGEVLQNRTWQFAGVFSQERAVVLESDLIGVIDTKGNMASECKWEDTTGQYQNGFLAVRKGDFWGYLNLEGDLAIPLMFDEADSFCNGLAAVKKGGKYGYINTVGEVCIDCQFLSAGSFIDGLALVETENGNQFIRQDGTLLVNEFFDDAKEFSNGLAAVCKNNKWGYLDSNGELRVSYLFSQAFFFDHGTSVVEINTPNGETEKFFLNEEGDMISSFIEDKRFLNAW